jgi:hypothetical protein
LVFVARTAFIANGEWHFTLFDDAMISMRYARNLADGHGLRWNAAEPPVEGYTNFLWTLWMATIHLTAAPESKTSLLVMFSGAVILLLNLVVVAKIAARLAPEAPLVASLAVWLTALYYPLVYWTLRGMEVGFVTLTLSTSVLLALRLHDRFRDRDLAALALVMALGILTRIDVVIPCAVIAGFACWTVRAEHRKVALVLGGAIAGTLAGHTAFRVFYYDALLPNTYYLKVQGAALDARLHRGLRGLVVIGVLHLIVPVFIAAGVFITRPRTVHPGACLLASIFLTLCAYSVYVGGDAWDWMGYANRYITPGMPGLLILAALGLDRLTGEHSRSRRWAIPGLACLFLVAGLVTLSVAPPSIQDVALTPGDERLRILRAALTLMPILVLPLLFPQPSIDGARNGRTWRRPVVMVTLAIASAVAINGQAIGLWLVHNAFYVDDDAWTTRYGLALRAATAEDASIAVTWGGAIPYFSQRPTVDLLGKSDRVIAKRERQRSVGFEPGHDKWDYSYSIGELRPDVVAELWGATDEDFAAIEKWGYLRLAPWVFVRADSARVDKAAVKHAACTILQEDAFILGAAKKSVPDLETLLVRYCRG